MIAMGAKRNAVSFPSRVASETKQNEKGRAGRPFRLRLHVRLQKLQKDDQQDDQEDEAKKADSDVHRSSFQFTTMS
jgi:hypothetical protein